MGSFYFMIRTFKKALKFPIYAYYYVYIQGLYGCISRDESATHEFDTFIIYTYNELDG